MSSLDVRMFTVGPVQENCLHRAPQGRSERGDRRPRRRGPEAAQRARERSAIETVEAILLTHTHFDHVGAVAPVAPATGAPVYCPSSRPRCSPTSWTTCRGPGSGRSRAIEADHTVGGGETLQLAGLELEVIFTPGSQPRPRHATRSATRRRCSRATCCSRARSAASTSRAATGRRCWSSIETLTNAYPARDDRLPGPHGDHDARRERDTNPFLRELAHHS